MRDTEYPNGPRVIINGPDKWLPEQGKADGERGLKPCTDDPRYLKAYEAAIKAKGEE